MQPRTYSTHYFSKRNEDKIQAQQQAVSKALRAPEAKVHHSLVQTQVQVQTQAQVQKQVQQQAPQQTPQQISQEELSRIFNTAIISTQSISKKNLSGELYELTQSASYKVILSAVRQLSRLQEIPERQAAEQIIKTFKKMDAIWEEYVFQEGLEQIRQAKSSS